MQHLSLVFVLMIAASTSAASPLLTCTDPAPNPNNTFNDIYTVTLNTDNQTAQVVHQKSGAFYDESTLDCTPDSDPTLTSCAGYDLVATCRPRVLTEGAYQVQVLRNQLAGTTRLNLWSIGPLGYILGNLVCR